MADFAREQLKRFGWVEGKGLGKNENGISTALKPKLKFDTYGVGHKPGEQFSFKWWDQVFNSAARNFDFINSEKGVSVKRRNKSFEISTKKKVKKKEKVYVNFIKVGTLNDNTFTPCDGGGDKSEDEDFISKETDEDVFRKCKGRTAHKAARHGYQMNGKLKRIEEQERAYMALQNGEETPVRVEQQDNRLYAKKKNNRVSDLKDVRTKKKRISSEQDLLNQKKNARKTSHNMCSFSVSDVKTTKKCSKR